MSIPGAALDENALRNFREFLETYNRISESCFNRCVVNVNSRQLTKEESDCSDLCTAKNVSLNHKILSAFMVEQPRITEKKVQDAQKEAEAVMKKLEEQGIDAKNLSPQEMAQKMMESLQTSAPKPNNA